MNDEWISPRATPDRDSKYMGLAWVHAAFSKDPSTQCGAYIVSENNEPLGSGYNGPPRLIEDDSFSWCRPPKDDPEAFSKYDVVRHAEENAIKFSNCRDLSGATMYVTAHPCKKCMLQIVEQEFNRVVYMDWKSDRGSMLSDKQREVSERIAELGGVNLELFDGDIAWIKDWVLKLDQIGVF